MQNGIAREEEPLGGGGVEQAGACQLKAIVDDADVLMEGAYDIGRG